MTIRILTALLACTMSMAASAQAMFFKTAKVADSTSIEQTTRKAFETEGAAQPVVKKTLPINKVSDTIRIDELSEDELEYFEEIFAALDSVTYDTVVVMKPLPDVFFMPAVYRTFEFADTLSPLLADFSGRPEMRWLEEENGQIRNMKRIQRSLFLEHPEYVKYNISMLPEAPKVYHAVVNPEDHTIRIEEGVLEKPKAPTFEAAQVRKRHWIRSFEASLQFSQAYVSPNWYQGGKSNLNMLAILYYNVKLNQAYHPNLLFENTFRYKLGMNNAPDDKVHDYSISDDLFQINTTFGVKAAKRWYYSFTGQFKTQLLNFYPTNSHDIRSAFLSPGELNVGIGMTYNYANPKKTFTFDASIAPLSYNLKMVLNDKVRPQNFGVDEGHKTKHTFGSNTELKLNWKICYNITFSSRIFAFTNYDNAYVDWENHITFDINRFLPTNIFCNARYDTNTPKCDDPSWHKLQVKEIISVGFSYKFNSI